MDLIISTQSNNFSLQLVDLPGVLGTLLASWNGAGETNLSSLRVNYQLSPFHVNIIGGGEKEERVDSLNNRDWTRKGVMMFVILLW